MKSSIKKLCRILIEDYDTSSLDSVYIGLQKQIREESDYFQKYNTVDRFEIIYGIFSLGNFGSFDWAERVLPNLNLVSVFNYKEEDYHEQECEDCGGDGNIHCEYCGGNGKTSCDVCEGEGELECETCEGGGMVDGDECEDCGGDGTIPCSNCDSDGTVICEVCENHGEVECEKCDGRGEYETDFLNYSVYNYLIYNEGLLRYLKERDEIDRPIGEDLDFLEGYETYECFLISNQIRNEKFAPFVEPDSDYCFYVEPLSKENVHWYGDAPVVMSSLTYDSATKYLQY